MNRDFKGIWIPREIWLCKGLSAQEKALWAEIHSLYDRERGGCFASNEYLCEFMDVKERRLREMISNLKEHGLIEVVSFDGRIRVLKAVSPKEDEEIRRADRQKSAGLGGRKVPVSGAEKCHSHNIYREKDITKKNTAQTAPPLRTEATQISFSFEERKFLHIDERDLSQWKEAYPSIDINLELKKMVEWCLSNDKKSKSKKLWRKFITNWLSNANEKAINKQSIQNSNAKGSNFSDRRTKNKDGSPVSSEYDGMF